MMTFMTEGDGVKIEEFSYHEDNFTKSTTQLNPINSHQP